MRWSSRPARPSTTNAAKCGNPTMITGFALIIAQMQSQAAHPDICLTITKSIGSLERSASFRDGTWRGYDLTHDLIDLEFPRQPCNRRRMAPYTH